VDFLDFFIRQLLALLGALAGALLTQSWQPLEHFLQAAGGGGGIGVLLLIFALLALFSLLALAGAMIIYLRNRRRRDAAAQPAVRTR
jgi:hypothetical protein